MKESVQSLEVFKISRKFDSYREQILEIDKQINFMQSNVNLLKAKKIGLLQALAKLEENIITEILDGK